MVYLRVTKRFPNLSYNSIFVTWQIFFDSDSFFFLLSSKFYPLAKTVSVYLLFIEFSNVKEFYSQLCETFHIYYPFLNSNFSSVHD